MSRVGTATAEAEAPTRRRSRPGVEPSRVASDPTENRDRPDRTQTRAAATGPRRDEVGPGSATAIDAGGAEPTGLDRRTIVLPAPGLVAGAAIGLYGLAAYLLYGGLLRDTVTSQRVRSYEAADHRLVLLAHLLAGLLVLLPSAIGSRQVRLPVAGGRRRSGRERPTRSAPVTALALLPLFLICVGGQQALVARDRYLPDWPVPPAFKLGSPLYTVGVAALLFAALARSRGPVRRNPGLAIWAGLAGYLTVGIAMGTRELAIPAVAIAFLLADRAGVRRKGALAAIAATTFLMATSLALELRLPGPGHGLRYYLPELLRLDSYLSHWLASMANILNGFHASGAAMISAPTNGLEPSAIVVDAVNPMPNLASSVRARSGLLEFATNFPVPTLGFTWSAGATIFVAWHLAAGLLFRASLGSLRRTAAESAVPLSARLGLLAAPYGLALMYVAFTVQYKIFSTAVILHLQAAVVLAQLLFWEGTKRALDHRARSRQAPEVGHGP